MKFGNGTAAVILAAGSSSRFGRPKQALMLEGETLVQRACRSALEAGLSPVFLVVSRKDRCWGELPDSIRVLENPHHLEGMGTSLALAAQAAAGTEAQALVVMLADQPAVDAGLLRRLLSLLGPPEITLVLSDAGDRQGPPACFARCHFIALSRLSGDQGGKSIAAGHEANVACLHAPESAWDIDDEAAWQAYLSR